MNPWFVLKKAWTKRLLDFNWIKKTLSRNSKLPTKWAYTKFVRLNFNDAITYAGDATGTNSYQIVEPHMVQWIPYDKYTKNKKKAYIIDSYLYLYNAHGDDQINIRGIFENPEELSKYTSCLPQAKCFF